jgi:hypothetical protein
MYIRIGSLLRPFLVLSILVSASLACAGRVFDELHVYSSPTRSLADVYDPSTDTILAENVWVFRPDGTFSAQLIINGDQLIMSGTYEGDDTGTGFFFLLDTDGDGKNDEEVELDVEEDEYSFISWEYGSDTFLFWLVE